jgi:hypothetical protein
MRYPYRSIFVIYLMNTGKCQPSAAVCRGDQKVTHDSPRQLRHPGREGVRGGGVGHHELLNILMINPTKQ